MSPFPYATVVDFYSSVIFKAFGAVQGFDLTHLLVSGTERALRFAADRSRT
jgi:hypothetical protein